MKKNKSLNILIINDSSNTFLPIFNNKKYNNTIVFDFDLSVKNSKNIRNFMSSNKGLLFNKSSFMVDIFLDDDVKTLVLTRYLNMYKEEFINCENKRENKPLTYVKFHPIFKKYAWIKDWR